MYAPPPIAPICCTVSQWKERSVQLVWNVLRPLATAPYQPIGQSALSPSSGTFPRWKRPAAAGLLQFVLVNVDKI